MDSTKHYLEIAESVVGEARELFISHLGAAPALFKASGDFATEADLAIEELMRSRLTGETGIPVYGEEQGGDLNSEACWVVDPIDGTSNYSSGNPNCSILVSLIYRGQPIVAVTEIPLMNMRLTALEGSPVYLNGEELPPIESETKAASQVGVGSVRSPDSERFPADVRLNLMATLADTDLRPRISGSVGVDFAFVAQGIYQAAVSFSPHLWDNSAGILLARSAGAVVTGTNGEPWTMESVGAIAGTRRAHKIALSTMRSVCP
ncbi:inositol monophosphatase family protein [Corynebacterium liangguodongii]|uniref:Inositol monophosphatase n=1 Tax=Corynebacterium liangguodongii TaxID=2079535 RepID=A0A2S0WEW2_9CORY|nr:inositol monophosphatase family protein [Corynebacterium liangguodongii]AWB84311.1 inositol monophosphatase [Corynebacterium liangguodongii]PWB99801.1 inositol monophosphatase family protein [Corynebacterium liangguodongii]